jgi:hypothetical protein
MSNGKFALIEDGILQIDQKLDRSVVLNTFQSTNHFVLDCLPSESGSLGDDMDYDFWYAALGHLFKTNVNQKLYEDGDLLPDCPSTFTCDPCALSKFKHPVPTLVVFKSKAVFELIYTDICKSFPDESFGGSKYLLRSLMFSPVSRGYSFLNKNRIPPSLFTQFLTMMNDNSVKTFTELAVIMVAKISLVN